MYVAGMERLRTPTLRAALVPAAAARASEDANLASASRTCARVVMKHIRMPVAHQPHMCVTMA
jgi:hypothetical protein